MPEKHTSGSPPYYAAITYASSLALCNLVSVCLFLMGFSQEDFLCPSKKEPQSYGCNGPLFLPKMILICVTPFHFTKDYENSDSG